MNVSILTAIAIQYSENRLHYTMEYITIGCILQTCTENLWFRDKNNLLRKRKLIAQDEISDICHLGV